MSHQELTENEFLTEVKKQFNKPKLTIIEYVILKTFYNSAGYREWGTNIQLATDGRGLIFPKVVGLTEDIELTSNTGEGRKLEAAILQGKATLN